MACELKGFVMYHVCIMTELRTSIISSLKYCRLQSNYPEFLSLVLTPYMTSHTHLRYSTNSSVNIHQFTILNFVFFNDAENFKNTVKVSPKIIKMQSQFTVHSSQSHFQPQGHCRSKRSCLFMPILMRCTA
jgi:hypothetical protein